MLDPPPTDSGQADAPITSPPIQDPNSCAIVAAIIENPARTQAWPPDPRIRGERCRRFKPSSFQRQVRAKPEYGIPRLVFLISLFDGIGTATVAVTQLVLELGAIDRLGRAWFLERDQVIAQKVADHWARKAAAEHHAAYQCEGFDVWDLLRHECSRLLSGLNKIPVSSFVILVAGSPCTQPTFAGKFAGQLGICGKDSVAVFALPFIGFHIQLFRPDLLAHGLLENAGSMSEAVKKAICGALDFPLRHAMTITPDWTAFERSRHWFNTFGLWLENLKGGFPKPRKSPILRDWDFIGSQGPPLMRNRGVEGELVRIAFYQYGHLHLLWCKNEWGHVKPADRRRLVQARMPSNVATGWTKIHDSSDHSQISDKDPDVIAAITWLYSEGPQIGVRPSTSAEMARDFGLDCYPALIELDMFVAILRPAFFRFLNGIDQPRIQEWLNQSDLFILFQQVSHSITTRNQTLQDACATHPIPEDLIQLGFTGRRDADLHGKHKNIEIMLTDFKQGSYKPGCCPTPRRFQPAAARLHQTGPQVSSIISALDLLTAPTNAERALECASDLQWLQLLIIKCCKTLRLASGRAPTALQAWSCLASLIYGVKTPRPHLLILRLTDGPHGSK